MTYNNKVSWFDNARTAQLNCPCWRTCNFFDVATQGLAEVHKAISHGAVLQKELKGADEKVVMDSDYADDLAVMDNTEEGLQESTDLIAYYTSYAGLKINSKKTQYMAISKCGMEEYAAPQKRCV